MLSYSQDVMDQKTHLLSQLQFLEGVDPGVLRRLIERAIERNFQPGEIILQEGSVGREVLLILEGLVEVIKNQGGEDVFLARCGTGQVFGEMGFLEDRPRFATIRALQPTRVLELSEAGMRAVFAEQPELLFRTTQVLSHRLRESQELMIADLQNKNREIARAYEELKLAQAAMVVKERMERELELARNLQESFLPHHFPRLPGVEIAARSQPARQVGGDFYDVIPLGNQQVGLVVADVSGKGMPAALFMALTRSLIRAESRRSLSPRQVLLNTHQLLLEIIRTSMFVTIFYGVLDLSTRQMRFARAGHDYPIIFTPATRDYRILNVEGTMLGMFGEAYLDEAETILNPGDWLILYSDGITEATSPAGEFFGIQNLINVLRTSQASTPQQVCDEILDQIKVFQGGAVPYDDMTLLAIKLVANPEDPVAVERQVERSTHE
jgi:sigma-B regulation protein RsbU (phosphoserine phosphatase)